MNNLYNPTDVSKILERINQLNTDSPRQWGKMNVAQMLAHCNISLETALKINHPPRIFIGRILSPFIKAKFVSGKPFDKNYPTDKSYVFTDSRELEKERTKVISSIKKFHEGGPEKCTRHPHSFFGKLSPEEWGITQWKHFDHHLRQFGV